VRTQNHALFAEFFSESPNLYGYQGNFTCETYLVFYTILIELAEDILTVACRCSAGSKSICGRNRSIIELKQCITNIKMHRNTEVQLCGMMNQRR
jgi:hypothetical protein